MAAEKIVTESALAALASDAKRAIYDVLPGGSATGNPCTFDTDIAVPLKSLIANIVASGGNGTPSTPIPIVGHSELNLVRCGKNQAVETVKGYVETNNSKIIVDNDSESVVFLAIEGQAYTVSSSVTMARNAIAKVDSDTIVNNMPCYNIQILSSDTWIANFTGWAIWYKVPNVSVDFENSVQVELGSTATAYAPYNGDTFTVQFGQTVYGGVYDANRGKVKPNVYYPSYNGETITGRWLSSKDVYVEGNTPTTGAQVVCLNEYDTEIDVSELSVDTIVGVNNITSDGGGDVEVEYRESVEKYVTEHGGGASWTDVVGTLTAGNTNITLSNAAIKTTSTIQVFTDPEVPYSTLAVSSGSATLTFDAQANDVSVKVRVT